MNSYTIYFTGSNKTKWHTEGNFQFSSKAITSSRKSTSNAAEIVELSEVEIEILKLMSKIGSSLSFYDLVGSLRFHQTLLKHYLDNLEEADYIEEEYEQQYILSRKGRSFAITNKLI